MQGGATRRRVVSHFSTKIPLRRYFSGSAAVGYSLLFASLILTPYFYFLACPQTLSEVHQLHAPLGDADGPTEPQPHLVACRASGRRVGRA